MEHTLHRAVLCWDISIAIPLDSLTLSGVHAYVSCVCACVSDVRVCAVCVLCVLCVRRSWTESEESEARSRTVLKLVRAAAAVADGGFARWLRAIGNWELGLGSGNQLPTELRVSRYVGRIEHLPGNQASLLLHFFRDVNRSCRQSVGLQERRTKKDSSRASGFKVQASARTQTPPM